MRSRSLALLIGLTACQEVPTPTSSFFEETIFPDLRDSCVRQTTGCHLASLEGTAAGNLDLASFDALMRRQDVLPSVGPYPVGLLLLKAGPQETIQVETFDAPDPENPDDRFVSIATDVRHNAGSTISRSSNFYRNVRSWIDDGYTRSGVPPTELSTSRGSCRNGVGRAQGFDANVDPDTAAYTSFKRDVEPVLVETCAGSLCHGSRIADFYLTCGESEAEHRWNYFVALSHVDRSVTTSEILRRPLANSAGGTFHEGGDVFASVDDARYATIRDWAQAIADDEPELLEVSDATDELRFFANRVQPVLVRKGCMFLNCHSPAMFHDLRLRGGSRGVFSRIATERNYEMSRLLLAVESPDPNDSRIIAKNLFPPAEVPGADGMAHRGGFLFEDFSSGGTTTAATKDLCAGVDADTGDLNEIPAYCVLVRWHELEREAAIARGEVLEDDSPVSAIVWVARPIGSASDVRDFDTFRGGADLRIADATMTAGALSLGTSASLLGDCGLGSSPDVRTPAVSWDAERVAFAARSSADAPLRIYEVRPDGSNCAAVSGLAADDNEVNGILTHDFDPAYAPDGRLIFASTRGNLDASRYSYDGPTRTPAAMQPNANLYIFEDDGVRQLTFLLNQEVAPSLMADGRVIFTAEKREPDFHQLALRRMNLDGADYHPLFAQRPSIGFATATEVVELPNRNLAFVASTLDAVEGAGTIAIVNRSIGPDQDDRDPGDRFYLHSLGTPEPGAFAGGTGVFRSPSPLPSGGVLVSCDEGATSLTAGDFAFDLCELDPGSGDVTVVGGESGMANVEAVAVYPRFDHGVFRSRIDEANGNSRIDADETNATVHLQDAHLLASLLFANTRTGRAVNRDVGGIEVYESLPPPASATDFSDVGDDVESDAFGDVYVRRESLGHADLAADGSARLLLPGGTPLVFGLLDSHGESLTFGEDDPFEGEMIQREQMQFYPGEHANQGLQSRFFNGLCGGCHGSISGRELDVAVNIDVLTHASRTLSRTADPVDLTR